MYPIALHLQGKKCIVFGAGKVAQRRVWGLLESGAEVTVAAPEPMPACWKNAKLTYLQPVSYTHLDVYKRQLHARTVSLESGLRR